jgi:hypothetical protein
MTREQFLERLSKLSPKDQTGLSALAKQIMDDAREPVRAAVQLWTTGDPDQAGKAASVLREVEELAFVPITQPKDPADTAHRVWLLRMAGMSLIDLRRKFVALIDRMLDDRRTPPAMPMPGPPAEENPALPRVCDEAYLAHRRLLNFAESPAQYYMNEREFLALPEEQRDEEIRNLRKTNTWTRLMR